MIALTAGLTIFFLLACVLSRWLGEGPRVQRFMLGMAAVFGLLFCVMLAGGHS